MKKNYPILLILVLCIIAFNLGLTLINYILFKWEEIATVFANLFVWLLGQAI